MMRVFDRIKSAAQLLVKGRTDSAFAALLRDGGFTPDNTVINARRAMQYYTSVAPIATAVGILAKEVASITPVLYNKKSEEFVYEGEVLSLLEHPNAVFSREAFMRALAGYFSLTGNAYVIATGTVTKPALELYLVKPDTIEIMPNREDGFPQTYRVNLSNGVATYTRQEVDGGFRYYNGSEQELWHIKNFNPQYSTDNLYGASDLCGIYYEIEQYLNSNIHNLAMLRNGARPSGALTSKSNVSQDQVDRIRGELRNQHAGATNAGRMLFFEGGDFEFIDFVKSNRDMDYLNNKKDVAISIYNQLGIPLPLVSPEQMTLDNYGGAKLSLYDNRVLPLTSLLYNELTLFLMPRYKTKDLVLDYDDGMIAALEPRRNDEITKKRESGVLTINEIRKLFGYETIGAEGDVLYQPMALVPVGTDKYTQDNPKKPKVKTGLHEVLAKKNTDGSPRFSDDFKERVRNGFDS